MWKLLILIHLACGNIDGSLENIQLMRIEVFFNCISLIDLLKKRLNLVQTTDSYEFIKNNPPIDDIYIVGSDQVWCDDLVGDLIGNYLFDWAPEFAKRISYAASTGGQKIRDCEVVRNELRRFRYISVREESSIESVQQYVNTKVVDVCDPSLLLEASDYIEIEKKKFFLPHNYIVLFNLTNDKFTNECAKKLKGRLNTTAKAVP